MDKCKDCGGNLRPTDVSLCKSCNQTMREGLAGLHKHPVVEKPVARATPPKKKAASKKR